MRVAGPGFGASGSRRTSISQYHPRYTTPDPPRANGVEASLSLSRAIAYCERLSERRSCREREMQRGYCSHKVLFQPSQQLRLWGPRCDPPLRNTRDNQPHVRWLTNRGRVSTRTVTNPDMLVPETPHLRLANSGGTLLACVLLVAALRQLEHAVDLGRDRADPLQYLSETEKDTLFIFLHKVPGSKGQSLRL